MSITCKICSTDFAKIIPWQHLKTHGITTKDYKAQHGDVYSQDTLDKLATRVPHNKGKTVTDPSHLANIKTAIAIREERFQRGEFTRGPTTVSEDQRRRRSEKTIAYAVANPDLMKQRTKKAIETKIERGYDFGNSMRGRHQSDASKEKSRQTMILTNHKKTQQSHSDISERIASINLTLLSDITDTTLDLHCNECNTDFKFTKQYFHLAKFKTTLCPTCYPRLTPKQSKGETEVYNFISSLVADAISGYRETYHSKEIDIFIPSMKLGIEYNGLYWHSESALASINKSPTSDSDKTTYFKEKGIRLITIFEDEWEEHPEIVKSRLSNLVGRSEDKIYARKCSVIEISSKEASKFCNETHIMGAGRSNVRYGLYYHDELVSVMTFSKNNISRKNTNSWEINRFSSKLNTTVVGGASKLFAAFIKSHNPPSVISYADNRWGDGGLYSMLGFKQTKPGTPNYWYVKPNAGRIHRFTLRKTKEDDQSLTEYENRLAQGYNRIWDCGSSKWEWNR